MNEFEQIDVLCEEIKDLIRTFVGSDKEFRDKEEIRRHYLAEIGGHAAQIDRICQGVLKQ